ncbi:MAG: type IV toxin-antitoxin system AbiEi family antitoxin domain-containing protein [Acidimicrobiia bacterium]|nr:type IV toxin-antitoxin system AbiEi family antitoxin domain-containing protein [Acidimicrobiia bacterium]
MAVETTMKILSLASTTGGICTRQHLLDAGISASAVDRRRRSGLLQPVCDGVYQIGSMVGPLTAFYRATLAVPGSLLSRRSAAAAHGFSMFAAVDGADRHDVQVTAAHGTSRVLSGVVVHETRLMLDEDRVEIAPGLWATSPARTVFDLAAELSPRRLRHVVQLQVRAGNPTASELHACFESLNRRGVPGARHLSRILIELFAADPIPASELEHRVWIELSRHGVTGFQRQFRPPWYDGRRGIVDFAHPQLRLVLEADGRRWHSTDQAIEDDHRRDRLAASHGWVTIRVGWSEIVNRPAATMAEIAAVIDQRRLAAA